MKFHFKNIEQPSQLKGPEFKDSLTGRTLVVPDTDAAQSWRLLSEELSSDTCDTLAQFADRIAAILGASGTFDKKIQSSWVGAIPSKKLKEARLVDRAYVLSAVACCLSEATEAEDLAIVRLHALTDEFPEDLRNQIERTIHERGGQLSDPQRKILELAKLVAGDALRWSGKEWSGKESTDPKSDLPGADYSLHPLHGQGRISLVMGGAQYVKSYFFESARLPEIRGASGILEYANENILRKVYSRDGLFAVPECIVFAAGGSFLSFAPARIANEIANEIEREYNDLLLTGFSAAAAREFDLIELQYGLSPWVARNDRQDRGFGELCHYMSGAVQERRSGTPEEGRFPLHLPHQPSAHPLLERCTSCGVRPSCAFPRTKDNDDDEGYCESCARKALVGRITKSDDTGRYVSVPSQIGWDPASLSGLNSWPTLFSNYLNHNAEQSRLYTGSADAEKLQEIGAPRDLVDVAGKSGAIAVIYADGNNVSSKLAAVKSPCTYRQLSERLFETCREAVFRSLASNLSSSKGFHPFEILSIGGDDLLLIVPGVNALDLAVDIGCTFEHLWNSGSEGKSTTPSRFKGKLTRTFAAEPTLSLSIGVVIADASTPVVYLRDLAEELLKESKKKARKQILAKDKSGASVEKTFGAVDFQVLKSTGNILENIAKYRETSLQKTMKVRADSSKSTYTYRTLKFTARPYTLPELDGLITTAREFERAAIPRSQLYSLRRSLMTSKTSSTLEYLYVRKRAHSNEAKSMFDHLEKNWYGTKDAPWLRVDGCSVETYETFLADLIEVMPFVSKKTATEASAHALK